MPFPVALMRASQGIQALGSRWGSSNSTRYQFTSDAADESDAESVGSPSVPAIHSPVLGVWALVQPRSTPPRFLVNCILSGILSTTEATSFTGRSSPPAPSRLVTTTEITFLP